jgi:hypothetical protein
MNSCRPRQSGAAAFPGEKSLTLVWGGIRLIAHALLARIEKRNTCAAPTGIPLPSSKELWQKEIGAATAETWFLLAKYARNPTSLLVG